MAPLAVDPLALDGAGSAVISVGSDFGWTISTLTGTLSESASMCGNDPAGAAVGRDYDNAASALLSAMVTTRNTLCHIGDGVRMSACNYSVAGAASNVAGRSEPLPAPAPTGNMSGGSLPSSIGSADSAPPGWGWGWVAPYIGMIWPNGDSAQLRAAAAAWIAAGSQFMATELGAAGPLGVVGAQQIPEGDAIGTAFGEAVRSTSSIVVQCNTMAGQLTAYAAQIDAVHAAIIDLLSRICDPVTGFKEVLDVLTGEDQDEIKKIADDIRTVVDNFSA
jgi:hypothetical protein